MEKIHKTIIADERDPSSEGMLLAAKHEVTLAPFFVVQKDAADPKPSIYTMYFQLKKEARPIPTLTRRMLLVKSVCATGVRR